MTVVALVGDCCTTTAVATMSARTGVDTMLVEADRSGGSIAAWFDVPASPSLSTIVARELGTDGDTSTDELVLDLARTHTSGLRFVPAPVRSVEAARAVAEAESTVFPSLASSQRTFLVDVGRRTAADGPSRTLALSSTVVVCHRQAGLPAGAAAARLERTAELAASLVDEGTPSLVLALIGSQPFHPDEVARFVEDTTPSPVLTVRLEEDPLAAATIAGRRGVSARRFARLPLIRAAGALANVIAGASVDAQSTRGARP